MQRFHVNLSVSDLQRSVAFYVHLFGSEPTVLKEDYAKWMLEDPRINFSLTESPHRSGINHLGLQVDSAAELAVLRQRAVDAGEQTLEQPDASCCYARSSKSWLRDPDDVAWETFVTHGSIAHFGTDRNAGV